MKVTTHDSILPSIDDLSTVSGGQYVSPAYQQQAYLQQQQGYGMDPNQLALQQPYQSGYGGYGGYGSAYGYGGGIGSTLGSMFDGAATSFGYSFGSQLGMIAAQLIGGLIAGR